VRETGEPQSDDEVEEESLDQGLKALGEWQRRQQSQQGQPLLADEPPGDG
jgi:hypothetical protein